LPSALARIGLVGKGDPAHPRPKLWEAMKPVSSEFDVIVAGGGIAGLTAGLTSARLGRKTLVLTGDVLGGQLLSINRIDGYPGFPEGVAGYDLCPMAQEQAGAAGAEFAMTELTDFSSHGQGWRIATAAGDAHDARALIVATGTALKTLGVPGEERLFGKGVSHCASCDAPLMKERVVAVVGGGDSAAQEALTLADFAARVIIIHRGDTLSAQAAYRDAVTGHPKIELRFNTVVQEILGKARVTGVRLRDASSGQTEDMDLAGVFAYIGTEPNTAFLAGKVGLDEAGRIATDDALRTDLAGVFAAGSVRSGWLGRAVMSAGDGAAAAMSAHRFLGVTHG
jgi:thioredoxin reductase (NADPH)